MVINQNDYNVLKQPFINKFLRLDLLNFNMAVVDEISGLFVSCDVNVNADSDLRRSCSVELIVTDSSFNIAPGGKIFLNRYIRPWVGYENIYTGEVQWYNQGVYLINAPSWEYNSTTNSLSFQGLDLMSKLTGLRNGNLEGIPTVIPQGSNVREAIITTLELGGFTEYIVSDCLLDGGAVQEVPYDIEIQQGGNIYQILSALRDILPNYQMYFDVEGVFHYEKIPSGNEDPIMIDDDLWNSITVNETINTSFEDVKNVIEVYGATHDVENYSSNTTISGETIKLTIADLQPQEYTLIGFTLPQDVSGDLKISLNNETSHNLVDSSGNFISALEKDVYYVAYYQSDNTWLFLGHHQAFAKAEDDNPESPFYIGGEAGIIRLVLSGGEYENIMSDELAQQRADIELYWRCRMNDNLVLTTVPIPWMDVNILVSHKPINSDIEKKYMIKSFSVSYGDISAMTIQLVSFYSTNQ